MQVLRVLLEENPNPEYEMDLFVLLCFSCCFLFLFLLETLTDISRLLLFVVVWYPREYDICPVAT